MTARRFLWMTIPLSLLLVAGAASAATFTFTTVGLYDGGEGVYDVKSADLDGNGKPDLVVAGYNAARLTVRLNDGLGGFGAPQVFAGDNPCAIDLGDFNGDGKLDIATAKWDQEVVTVQLNQGAGTFDAGTSYPIHEPVRDLVSADFDGDGRLDIAVAAFPGEVFLLHGTAGGFDPPTLFLGGGRLKAIAAGDLDGDGRPDLAVCDYVNARAAIFHNEGAMAFSARPTITTGAGPSDILIADADGDGDNDVAVTCEDGHAVVALASGGILGPRSVYPTIGSLSQSIALADFDHDGLPDLAVTNYATNAIEILPGLVGGGFGTGQSGALAGGLRCAAITDVTGDGNLEIVTGDQGGSVRVVTVTIQAAPLVFGDGIPYTIGHGCYDVLVADLNGDHRPEILAALAGPARIALLVNDGTGHFTAPPQLGGGHACALAMTDADHDGYLDLLSANYNEGTFSYRHGQGGSGFDFPVDYAMGAGTRDLVLADFDGDGEPDVATANAASVTIRRGLGNGSFGALVSMNVGLALKGIATADLTGDGRPDLIVVDAQQGRAFILRNDGGLAFTILPVLTTDSAPSDVAIGDLDGDGLPDLAISTESSRLDLYRNLGGGTLGPKIQVSIGALSQSVELADFNNDGRLDVMVSSPGLVRIFAVMPGLQLAAIAGTAVQQVLVRDAAAGDFNGDGKLDFASGDDDGGTLRVFIQDAVTAPPPPPPPPLPPPGIACAGLRLSLPDLPSQLVVVDLDGDGVRDVAASTESGNACFLKALAYNPSGPRQDFAVGGGAKSIAAADLDGDNQPELVIAESLDRTLAVFRRVGPEFVELAHVEVGMHPQYVLAADFNRDGRPDLATANDPGGAAPGSITILLNRPEANWNPVPEPIDGSEGTDPVPVPAGGDPPPAGEAPIELPLPVGATMLAAADFDGDGNLDLAAVLRSSAIAVLYAMGDGRFHPAQVLPYGGTGIAVGNFDGDGRPDLAIADPATDLVRLVYNTVQDPWTTSATLPTEDAPSAVTVGDLNGDGRDDVTYVTATGGVFGTRLATGANTFRTYAPCVAGTDVRALVLAPRAEGGVDTYVLSYGDDTALLRSYPSGAFARMLEPASSAGPAIAFGLEAPMPNPAIGASGIGFTLPARAEVRLALYDVRGRLVRTLVDRALDAGRHEARWDGRDSSGRNAVPGVYFYRLSCALGSRIERLIVLGGR